MGTIVQMIPTANWLGFYDIDPKTGHFPVQYRDSLLDFPAVSNSGFPYGAAITNPPWFARTSGGRRQLTFKPGIPYDDLYKQALAVCLANCRWVAALVPESFLTTGLFLDRLEAVVRLPYDLFGNETEHPACLVLMVPAANGNPTIWNGDTFLGDLDSLMSHEVFYIAEADTIRVTFNHAGGEIGVFALDSREGPTIRFVPGENIDPEKVKRSSRHILRIKLPPRIENCNVEELIDRANAVLADYRCASADIALTASKCRRHDGIARRRIDFMTIRKIVTLALKAME
jgi:hypothetical protein